VRLDLGAVTLLAGVVEDVEVAQRAVRHRLGGCRGRGERHREQDGRHDDQE
jgi:hypothetical protein